MLPRTQSRVQLYPRREQRREQVVQARTLTASVDRALRSTEPETKHKAARRLELSPKPSRRPWPQARKVLWIFSVYWFCTGLAYMLSFLLSGPTHELAKRCGRGASLASNNSTVTAVPTVHVTPHVPALSVTSIRRALAARS